MISSISKLASTAVVAFAAVLGAPSASAAIVTGSWDPVLPAPFVNLGWVATVNLQIANNCVAGATGMFSVSIFGNGFGCSSAPRAQDFEVVRAQVGIYSTLTGAVVDVLQFAPPPGPLGVTLIEQMGQTVLTLNESQAVQGGGSGTEGFRFKFEVPGALPSLSYQDTGATGTFFTPANGDPVLTSFTVRADSELQSVLATTVLTVGQIIPGVTAVPEPGSLALALLALGLTGGIASRRTRGAGAAAKACA